MQMRESVLTHAYWRVLFAGDFAALVASESDAFQHNRMWIKISMLHWDNKWNTGIPAVFAS